MLLTLKHWLKILLILAKYLESLVVSFGLIWSQDPFRGLVWWYPFFRFVYEIGFAAYRYFKAVTLLSVSIRLRFGNADSRVT